MSKKSLPEIFKIIQEAETVEDKIKIIQAHYSVSVAAILSMLFNPNITFTLPKGLPEDFEKIPHAANMSLERAIRSFPAFVNKGELRADKKIKLQTAWLRLLKSISQAEAEFVTKVKDKEYEIGLTQAEVHLVFPNLIPEPQSFRPEDTKSEDIQKEATDVDGTGSEDVDSTSSSSVKDIDIEKKAEEAKLADETKKKIPSKKQAKTKNVE